MPPRATSTGALADSTRAVKVDGRNALAFYNRGLALRDKNDLDRAIQSFDQAIKLNPNYAAAYYNRGNALEFKRDYDRAIADFDAAFKGRSRIRRRALRRALSYGAKATMTAPSPTLTRPSSLSRPTRWPSTIAAIAYRLKGDIDRAIATREAVKLDGKFALGFYQRRQCVLREARLSIAPFVDFGEAIRFNPNFDLAYYHRGLAYRDSATSIAPSSISAKHPARRQERGRFRQPRLV